MGNTGRAAFWAVLAAVAFASATVLGKLLLTKVDFKAATLGRYGITTLISLVYLLVSGIGVPVARVTTSNWILVVVIGLTTGSGAIFLYYFGLTRVRATTATICELCLPLTAMVLDYVVNHSLLDPVQMVGGVFMIAAIAKVTSGKVHPRSTEHYEHSSE
jgi:drug/metabolite transporter (DMT)-like permease